jgi:hypothetical protein
MATKARRSKRDQWDFSFHFGVRLSRSKDPTNAPKARGRPRSGGENFAMAIWRSVLNLAIKYLPELFDFVRKVTAMISQNYLFSRLFVTDDEP